MVSSIVVYFILRLMSFGVYNWTARRKRSKSFTVESATKRPALTPKKVPDFRAIHQRNFDRMESIADYRNRREAAATRLLKPVTKGRFLVYLIYCYLKYMLKNCVCHCSRHEITHSRDFIRKLDRRQGRGNQGNG